MKPSLASQHRAPVLTVCGGRRRIYALAYVGGPVFDIVAEYDRVGEAWSALRAATDATDAFMGSERTK